MIGAGHPISLALLRGEVEDHDLAGRGAHQGLAHGGKNEMREHRRVPGPRPQNHPVRLINGPQRLRVGIGILRNDPHVLQASSG